MIGRLATAQVLFQCTFSSAPFPMHLFQCTTAAGKSSSGAFAEVGGVARCHFTPPVRERQFPQRNQDPDQDPGSIRSRTVDDPIHPENSGLGCNQANPADPPPTFPHFTCSDSMYPVRLWIRRITVCWSFSLTDERIDPQTGMSFDPCAF